MNRWLPALLVAVALLTGCVLPAAPTLPAGTPTPNITLDAIARMLTETRAAPTATVTPTQTTTPLPTRTLTGTPPAGSQPRPAGAGQAVSGAGGVLTVQVVEPPAAPRGVTGPLFAVEASIENPTGEPVEYNPLFFTLEDAGGEQHVPLTGQADHALLNGTLRPGEFVRGRVFFAPGAEPGAFKLAYRPEGEDGPALWFDLSGAEAASPATLVPRTGPVERPDLPAAGSPVEASGITVTVLQSVASERLYGRRAGRGLVFLDLEVEIRSGLGRRVAYNPQYFRVKDPDGYEYRPVTLSPETTLQAGSLEPTEKVTGRVTFQIQPDTEWLVLSYQPSMLFQEFETIRILVIPPAPGR